MEKRRCTGKLLLLCLFCFLMSGAGLTAQTWVVKPPGAPELIMAKNGSWTRWVRFYNEEDSLIREVDLVQENPFRDLPFKKVGNRYGMGIYDVSGIDISRQFLKIPLSNAEIVQIDGQIMTSNLVANHDYFCVSYILYLSVASTHVTDMIGWYVVYDKYGKKIGETKQHNVSGYPAEVSQDGNTIMIKRGGAYGGEGELHFAESYSIIDIDSNASILDFAPPKSIDILVDVFFATDYYFVLSASCGQDEVCCFILDEHRDFFYSKSSAWRNGQNYTIKISMNKIMWLLRAT